ncbi:MAG: hypothetical protein FWE04_02290, partial [Oscillospiraceae bacterium]|nr:hypothetical protein [Oscillospiraceae bacterium]
VGRRHSGDGWHKALSSLLLRDLDLRSGFGEEFHLLLPSKVFRGLRQNHRNLDFANGSSLRVSQENESYFDEV